MLSGFASGSIRITAAFVVYALAFNWLSRISIALLLEHLFPLHIQPLPKLPLDRTED